MSPKGAIDDYELHKQGPSTYEELFPRKPQRSRKSETVSNGLPATLPTALSGGPSQQIV
jgi:hypothetical protein